jgi:hypothetical protein
MSSALGPPRASPLVDLVVSILGLEWELLRCLVVGQPIKGDQEEIQDVTALVSEVVSVSTCYL